MNTRDLIGIKERVNLRTILVAGIMAAVGIIFLYFSTQIKHLVWQTFLRDFGSLLFVTVAIALLWELVVKRVFLDEVLAKAHISNEIISSGLSQITNDFYHDINWESLLRSISKLDVFFAYAQSWRNINKQAIEGIASRREAHIRVVLADYEDSQTIQELSRRFDYTVGKLSDLIKETERFFLGLKRTNGAKIDLWRLPMAPVYTVYFFDKSAVFTLYNHRKDRKPVPAFVCEEGGTLYDFFRKEFDAMIESPGFAKPIT